jgi:hypothetical protein
MKYTNIFGIVTLCTINCMSIGKVGYLVPLENDLRLHSDKIAAETCELQGEVDLITILNKRLSIQGTSDLSNVNLEYQTKGCLVFYEIEEK